MSSYSNCAIYPVLYSGITDVGDIGAYEKQALTNLPVERGVVLSPYYGVTVNGVSMPAYATRSVNGIHSFLYIDVGAERDFALDVEIKALVSDCILAAEGTWVTVLPQSCGVDARIEGGVIRASLCKAGSYSFVLNDQHLQPLTLFVAKKEDQAKVFNGYPVTYIQPGDYTQSDDMKGTVLAADRRVYYFKAGRYKIRTIEIAASDCVLYFESGTYFEVLPAPSGENTCALTCEALNNVKVAGRGLFDFSACCGGEVPPGYYANKSGLVFNGIDGLDISGLAAINSQTWTLCLNDCKNVLVHDCMFFGYRVFSDGIMLSDCKNAVVEENFIRTGDDAFETKSTTANGFTDNVLFRNNSAWTDKAVAYGCIYESNHDTRGVRFESCSVGFALGTWSPHLGCCVIQMGNRKGAVMEDIRFEDIEIFCSKNNGAINVYVGGSGGRGEGYGIVRNIRFSNVTVKHNHGHVVNLQTWDKENCFIHDLYLNNITSNGVLLTKQNSSDVNLVRNAVSGGYDQEKLLHVLPLK